MVYRNDAEAVPLTLLQMDRVLSKSGYAYEILAVGDGSTDGSKEIVGRMAGVIRHLKAITNEGDRGRGAALKQAMRLARGACRIFTDARHSFPADSAGAAAELLRDGFGIVLPVRRRGKGATGGGAVRQGVFARIGDWLGRALGIPFFLNAERGFAMSADAAENIFSKTVLPDRGFHAETLLVGSKLGYRTAVLPVAGFVSDNRAFSRYLQSVAQALIIRWRLMARGYGNALALF